MQEAGAQPLITARDAEIGMLRQQLTQISADLSRNLEVLAARDSECEESRQAITELTALLAEKDELFRQYQGQVAQLEALRQREVAECKVLQAALDSQQRDWQQQLRDEQTKREALEQQLQQSQEACTSQLLSARQAAVHEAVQHSTQHTAELEHAAGQQKQLQQQLQEVQAALATKESELAATQMQLASALDSTKQVQSNHGKAMAAKSALVAQLQQELDQVKAGIAQSNKTHEAHIAQLIASLNDMQQLCTKQATELQQHADRQKAAQEEVKGLHRALQQQQQAGDKAEMRRSAMETALQCEVAALATIKAQLGLLQNGVATLLADLQNQQTGAETTAAQLSALLSQTKEQLVSAAVAGNVQSSPHKVQCTHQLQDQCQCLATDLQVAQARSQCFLHTCAWLQQHIMPLLADSVAKGVLSPTAVPAELQSDAVLLPAHEQQSCMAALAHSVQQQQQQQKRQPAWGQPRAFTPQQQCSSPSPAQNPSDSGCCCRSPINQKRETAPAGLHLKREPRGPACNCKLCGALPTAPGSPGPAGCGNLLEGAACSCCQQDWATTQQPPGAMHLPQPGLACCVVSAHGAASTPAPLTGMVCQLQAGVARLQQQLSSSQQLVQRTRPAHTHGSPAATAARAMMDGSAVHTTSSFKAACCAAQPHHNVAVQESHNMHYQHHNQQWSPGSQQGLKHSRNRQQCMHEFGGMHATPPMHLPEPCIPAAFARGQQHVLGAAGQEEEDEEETASTCSRQLGSCSTPGSSRHSLSCSPEVAAAVVAARRRMQQHTAAPARRHTPASSRHPGIVSGCDRQGAIQAADLAALANATLKKLEQLSAESPCL